MDLDFTSVRGKMDSQNLPNPLQDLIESLLKNGNELKNWRVYGNLDGTNVVLKFIQKRERTFSEAVTPERIYSPTKCSTKHKSPANMQRDWERAAQHRDSRACQDKVDPFIDSGISQPSDRFG